MWMRSLFALLFLLLAGCEQQPLPFHGSNVGAIFAKSDFRLNDHNGKTHTLADFRGKVVLVFFGYTHCLDVCTTTLADLAQMMKLLGSDADKVQVLFVTIDPERDQAEVLKRYVPVFHPSFLGLYGDAAATAQAARAFRVVYQKQEAAAGYTMDHSVGAYLIDTKGKVRLHEPFGQRADWLAEDIRLLLTRN